MAAVVLAAVALSACNISTSQGDRAQSIVEAYLRAVAGGSGDRGWLLLHPATRRDIFNDNPNAYIAAVLATDWTSLSWQVATVEAEDPTLYEVVFAPTTEVPSFLVEHRQNLWLVGTRGPPRNELVMFVRLDEFGGTGIWAIGG